MEASLDEAGWGDGGGRARLVVGVGEAFTTLQRRREKLDFRSDCRYVLPGGMNHGWASTLVCEHCPVWNDFTGAAAAIIGAGESSALYPARGRAFGVCWISISRGVFFASCAAWRWSSSAFGTVSDLEIARLVRKQPRMILIFLVMVESDTLSMTKRVACVGGLYLGTYLR